MRLSSTLEPFAGPFPAGPPARVAILFSALRSLVLLLALLLSWAAHAQAPTVTVTPAGPFTLCPGSTQTFTATATVPGYNVAGSGFNDIVWALVRQADGKVLVGGDFTTYNGNAAAPDKVLRLNADGSLDTSFNPSGAGANGDVYALAVQADGKVLVGGAFTAYNGDAAAPNFVVRLNADGSLDNSFNNGGVGPTGSVVALAVQPDGKVLVGGSYGSGGYNGNAFAPHHVLRLNADGSLDTSFNIGATAGANNAVHALAVRADGKVLIGGLFTSYNGNVSAPRYVLRLNADGSLDTSFNPSGAGANGDVYVLTLLADGKVLVGGLFTAYNGNAAAPDRLLRLHADGSLDATFNPGGAGAANSVRAVVVQTDGKLLIGGNFTAYNGSASVPDHVLRLHANGSFDTTFNPGGAGANGDVLTMAVQADGKVLAGGTFTDYNGNAAAPDYVLRLNADGNLNNAASAPAGLAYTWSNGATEPSVTVSQPGDYQATATALTGTGYSAVVRVNAPAAARVRVTPAGPLVLPAGGSATLTATATVPGFNTAGAGFDGFVNVLAVQADGKVLVGGEFTVYNGNAAAPDRLLRLHPDGSPDNTFNAAGSGFNGEVRAVAVQPDGKVLVGGDFTAYNGNAAAPDHVLRLNADGTLDPSFNNAGAGANGHVHALAVQADGKVLVGGNFFSYNGNANAPDCVLRLQANGTLDTGFNNGPTAGAGGLVRALVVQADGKVLAGGNFAAYNGITVPYFLMRLHADGSRDNTFNNSGSGASDFVWAVAVQADGKVLVGGFFTAYNGNTNAPNQVLRLHANGTLDTSFNNGPAAGVNNAVLALAAQPDGKVLVGGAFTAYNGNANAPDGVLRLNADGTLDTGFNNGPTAGTPNAVVALAVQADSKVLIGGYFSAYNGNAAAPDKALRLNADGSFHDDATPLAGAAVVFPGNATGATFTVSAAGTYTATATDPATGCPYPSNAVVVTVAAPLATAAGGPAAPLQLHPNPARTAATLAGAAPGAPVQVFDALGRLALTATADARGTAVLALPAKLATGVYLVRSGFRTVRLMVE